MGYPIPAPTPRSRFLFPPPKNTLKMASGSRFVPLFGSRRPRALFRCFSGAFYTKLVYRSVCIHFLGQGGQKHTSIHTHFANKIRSFALFLDIYRGQIQQFLKTGPM